MRSTFLRPTARVPTLPVLLLGFLCCALAMLAAWGSPGRSLAAGDETHYLVLADGLVHDASLSPARAYVRAAEDGLQSGPPPVAERVLANNGVHLVHGPHGWYSVHGVGLAALIAPAALVGDEFGARLVMIAVGAAIVAIVWALAGLLVTSTNARLMAVVPLCISLPVVVSSTQIYPDLPGGALCLLGLLAVLWAEAGASLRRLVPCAAALALLPWLHLRFAVPAVVLVAALAWARPRAVAWLVAPLAVSAATLLGYHWWAFGSVTGPYGDDAVAVGWRSVMVLVGLGVDQNQGLVVQQPLHLVGLFFLVPFVRARPLVAWPMLMVIASIVLPSRGAPGVVRGADVLRPLRLGAVARVRAGDAVRPRAPRRRRGAGCSSQRWWWGVPCRRGTSSWRGAPAAPCSNGPTRPRSGLLHPLRCARPVAAGVVRPRLGVRARAQRGGGAGRGVVGGDRSCACAFPARRPPTLTRNGR